MMQSQRIDPLLRRAQQHEDEVARDLAERQRALSTHESRLEELRRYAEEYANSQMAATSPAQLANRRAFLDRLNSAVEQQCQTVDRNREKVEMERSRLLLASRDKQVLEQLAASYRAQERQAADRRSQREMDDLGARLARPSLGAANEDKEQQR
ncbi:flagellar export protein FliJ [Pseudoxanthomonas sp. JBR18]|uniref:flagellar export protein FliJ n=1 Tax=Pseudoxanthomonas sp. JBR18 TaxID=2969308 RepID=UPI0023062C0C|nr:flagellar export protein FliJ [Pseudoxanthomonas sp. JBR18]WCE03730.1 flagellar export protein FliJ [Pseudoxanthomonas sp. JBR18]